ncbi:MAG TPA: hypothetical protein VHC69_06875 [Polyangiaceae bacterium]|nr:hypothetical protein [Polyangiaceae bacterium]
MRWAPVAALAALLSACGGGLRTVPFGPRGSGGAPPFIVESAPPPPKVEKIPADPGKSCAWLDGRWEWVDQTWSWTPGAWVFVHPGCHYATPQALWVPASGRGLLFYLPGRWYRDSDGSACGEPLTCPH